MCLYSYMNAAKPGEEILIDARVIKSGRSLAFMDCEIRKKDDGKVILRGTHTKFVGGESFNDKAGLNTE